MERSENAAAFFWGRRQERRAFLRGSIKLIFGAGAAVVSGAIPDGISRERPGRSQGQRPSFGGYRRPEDYDSFHDYPLEAILEESSPTLTPTLTPTPTPTQTPTATPLPIVQPTTPATVTGLSDRDSCNEIRGTDYRSPGEREWFLSNCVSPEDRARALSAPSNPEVSGPLAPVYRHGDRSSPYISLTIDDAWSLPLVEMALDIAKVRGARLTLFPAGKMIDAGPAIFARAIDEGHEIANHTYSHTWLTELSREGILNEIEMAQAALDRALGRYYKMRFFRPPGMAGFTSGDGVPLIRSAIFEKGLAVALWDVDSFYSAIRLGGGVEEVVKAVTSNTWNGSIVLQHFTAADVGALESILNWVESRGLVPVTISELLKLA